MAFIRPDLLRKSLEHLRYLSPNILYVSIDGPRSKDEEGLVEECRSIALNPGWKCEIVPIFRDENIGLVKSFVKSMDKMFSEHEFGIFLEDDVLLSPTFLNFAEEIFIEYRNNNRVGHVNASNFIQDFQKPFSDSYFFSEYSHVWGFGTWRRIWKNYDLDMKSWKSVDQKKLINRHAFSLRERKHTKKMFDLHCENPDPWACDYQWHFNLLFNNALAVTPSVNMSLNIGFDREDSTHTKGQNPMALPLSKCSFPLKHPSIVERSIDYDKALAKKMCPSYSSVYFNKILNKINPFS
jgi:hypothetical protein